MIRQEKEMAVLIQRLLENPETEIVEFKEAKKSFDFDKLGRYFAALSNEANLRHAECGWLLLGVADNRLVCGTAFCREERIPSKGLHALKRKVAEHTNGSITFEEIYEIDMDGKRVIAFQIPPATFASPVSWKGEPWSRDGESLVRMPQYKLDMIYSQSRPDWSAQLAYEANYEDLDSDAVEFACRKFVGKYADDEPALLDLSNEDLLKKLGLIVHGHISNAALVLLGKPESAVFLGGVRPRITWTLYDSSDRTIAYEHFEPPFILQVDRVLGKIRNEKYRFFTSDETLFPTEDHRYNPEVIRELLHNAIAHQDYRLSGKIDVMEYEDRLLFRNEGSFIPGSIEVALESGYKPEYYRNALLTYAMSKTGMIDQNAIGIRNVFDIQRNRLLPMPTYDLSTPNRIAVTVFGKMLNESYTRLLAAQPELELSVVYLLDMIQKGYPITKEQGRMLRDRKLVEGRYPKLIIASAVAGVIGTYDEYVKAKGVDVNIRKELVLQVLRTHPCSRAEILSAIDYALPQDMKTKAKQDHVSYLLKSLRKEGKIDLQGSTSGAVWAIAD